MGVVLGADLMALDGFGFRQGVTTHAPLACTMHVLSSQMKWRSSAPIYAVET